MSKDSPARRAAANLSARAHRINELHARCQRSHEQTVLDAVAIGEELIAQKAELAHGEWIPWVAANANFSYEMATGYMRMARHPDTLEFARLGIAGVLKAIAAHGAERRPKSAMTTDLPASESPLSAEVAQRLRDARWRANQRLASDPKAWRFAHLGTRGVCQVIGALSGDSWADPRILDELGDDLVAEIEAWCGAEFERGMQRGADAPFLMASCDDDSIAAGARRTDIEELWVMLVVAMIALERPPERIVPYLTTPSRDGLERGLVAAMRMLREGRRDDVLAAVERWQSEVAA